MKGTVDYRFACGCSRTWTDGTTAGVIRVVRIHEDCAACRNRKEKAARAWARAYGKTQKGREPDGLR